MGLERLILRTRALLQKAARAAGLYRGALPLAWHRREPDSWLRQNLPEHSLAVPPLARMRDIERIAASINTLGPQPLWEGYRATYQHKPDVPWAQAALSRTPDQVRSQAEIGCLFAWMAATRRPQLIVEFGTAFGISAMYWSAGLDQAGAGRLLTFEPNEVWQAIAAARLGEFSKRAIPVLGTFEDKIADYLKHGETIDMAFVDAIHTSDFVTPQVELLITRLAPGGLIILDDISFSDDMRQCWQRWANDRRVTASVAVADRVGILEFGQMVSRSK
jgi:predicted O-methyltransferase YrrM